MSYEWFLNIRLYHVKLSVLIRFEMDNPTEIDLSILHFRQGTRLCFF